VTSSFHPSASAFLAGGPGAHQHQPSRYHRQGVLCVSCVLWEPRAAPLPDVWLLTATMTMQARRLERSSAQTRGGGSWQRKAEGCSEREGWRVEARVGELRWMQREVAAMCEVAR
jgi:hypothetical protein